MELNRRQVLKLAGLGVTATAVPGVLAACSNGSGGGAGDGSVKFEGWDYEATLVQQNLDNFTKTSNVKVNYTPITSAQYVQKVVAEFTGGGGPDALYVYDDSLAAWVEGEYLQPIDGLPGVDDVYAAIFPGNAEAMTYQGKRYGLPYYTDSNCLIYNADILAKAGFSKPPASLEELEAQAVKIKSMGLLEYPIGLPAQLSDTWWAWVWGLVYSSGGDMFDDQQAPIMNTTDTVTKDVLTWLQNAANKSKVLDPASLQLLPVPVDNAMKANRYAFTIGARYALRDYNDPQKSKAAGKMKMALVPSLDGKVHGTISNTRMYGLAKDTEVKDDAFKLLTYLGGFDASKQPYTAKFWFQQRGLGFAYKELAKDPEIVAALKKFADPAIYAQLAEIARPRNVLGVAWYTEFETEMHKVVQGVLSNQTQPSAAVASLAQTAGTLKKKYS
ncbi:extracellular solute-binding protein [Kribbella sandramycini]|uniref:Extracellular solute-binding protein n=1 Tax=Kribbella sandramycini TaxID=60450 RepID=A0A7Y4KVE5_9ACTN|nr:extracellular solute-binding protein [Kribbella sandramycini]MBB6568142.1 multiple sugar transport system substrate-binding protein [Kribbella sandramycini]NOL39264.1 extracellular solute-binding protein [Kribbella sandramycini]